MNNNLAIRIHARAGQGAKTMAQLLVEAAAAQGKYVQAFPFYGPARGGAPMDAFARISDRPIRLHTPITEPDILVIVDETLLASSKMLSQLRPNQILLINTNKTASAITKEYQCAARVQVVDASAIAIKNLRKNLANTALLGALAKIANLIKLEDLLKVVEEKFSKKLGPELTTANLQTIKEGYEAI